MDMPGYLDYGKMAMMDPMAYKQATDQLGLAQLYQAEKQKQAENMTLEGVLKNDQSKVMNPLLAQHQSLQNQGLDIGNQDKDLSLGIRKATYPQELQDKISKYALSADEDKLKAAEQKINLDYMSGDPARIERAKHGEQFVAAVRAEQRKYQAEMAKVQEQGKNHLQVAREQIAGQLKGKQMDIDAGRWEKRTTTNMAIKFASLPPATRIGNLRAALASGKDPITGEDMDNETRGMYQAMMEQDAATLDAANNARGGNAGVTLNIPQGGGSPALVNKTPVTVNPKGTPKLPPGVTIVGQ